MKRYLAMAAVAGLALSALGAMDQKVIQVTVTTTNTGTTQIRGEVRAIGVVIPAAFTADVAVTSSEGTTLLAASGLKSGTNWYQPRTPVHTAAGAAISHSVLTPGMTLTNATSTILTYSRAYEAVTNIILSCLDTNTGAVTTNEVVTMIPGDLTITTNTLVVGAAGDSSVTTNAIAVYEPFSVVGDVTATFVHAGGVTGTCSVVINFVK